MIAINTALIKFPYRVRTLRRNAHNPTCCSSIPIAHHTAPDNSRRRKLKISKKQRLSVRREDTLDIAWDDDAPKISAGDIGYVDIDDVQEHHLQSALKVAGSLIPTPGTLQLSDEHYTQLYPPLQWRDSEVYINTEKELDFGNVLSGDGYLLDETDADWLQSNNQVANGKTISEDDMELVMGIFEQLTGLQVIPAEVCGRSILIAARQEPRDWASYMILFSSKLAATCFASGMVPSWVPPPHSLVYIAQQVYPHWRHRRTLLDNSKLRPSHNYHEKSFSEDAYQCFRPRSHPTARAMCSLRRRSTGSQKPLNLTPIPSRKLRLLPPRPPQERIPASVRSQNPRPTKIRLVVRDDRQSSTATSSSSHDPLWDPDEGTSTHSSAKAGLSEVEGLRDSEVADLAAAGVHAPRAYHATQALDNGTSTNVADKPRHTVDPLVRERNRLNAQRSRDNRKAELATLTAEVERLQRVAAYLHDCLQLAQENASISAGLSVLSQLVNAASNG
ncbi:hypothetical protein R3P38DRAFT_3608950 [Favolaschia claudopus]|uniref:Enhancer of polycomb-like protein n=2 Tax=Favolaschia claudopus TaxID=2862362 RepID=A0AAW0A6V5_9AGAR